MAILLSRTDFQTVYQKGESTVGASDRHEEDVESRSERFVLPSMNKYERNHGQLYEEQDGPDPGFEPPPDGPVVVAAKVIFISHVSHGR